jgi:hypothetical protein
MFFGESMSESQNVWVIGVLGHEYKKSSAMCRAFFIGE